MTEEELDGKEKSFYQLCHYGTMSEATRDLAIEVITSHRTLNSRNAKLINENDELMAENEKLKAALIRERDDALIWDGITVVNRINKILEELK